MDDILMCPTCGSDCCINLAVPRRIYPRCENQCCNFAMKVAKCQAMPAGQLVAELKDSPRTIVPFNPDGTDGSQFAIGALSEDFATNDKGQRILSTMNPPYCGPNEVEMYACGRFKRKDIQGDDNYIAAARASGLPIRVIGGEVFIGGAA